MAPILVKGTQGHYIPWQTLDLTGLVSGLPDTHIGTLTWIRAFEEATVGRSLGDVKVYGTKTLGMSAMETMLKNNGCKWVISPKADGTELNAYCGMLWAALRSILHRLMKDYCEVNFSQGLTIPQHTLVIVTLRSFEHRLRLEK